jgi:hypothetical protein
MKKFFAIFGLTLFMCGAIYLLLNENKFLKTSRKKHQNKNLVVSISKKIGEKRRQDFTPYELQRMRINAESVIHFESTKTSESYELDESELEEFSKQLNGVRAINSIDSNHMIPSDVVDQRKKNIKE